MKIVITGGGGYVGSELVSELADNGHEIICLDRFSSEEPQFGEKYENKIKILKSDIRDVDSKILTGQDLVIDLAVLSKNLERSKDDEIFDINHKARVNIAILSKDVGVKRYILGSSTSMYGQNDVIVDESSSVNPMSLYDKANRNAEIDILALNSSNFTVTILRFSSIYGISKRMRWDQSVNNMILEFYKTGKILVKGQHNKRPFLHINDAIQAYNIIIKSPKEKIGGEIFNVGSDNQNYDMKSVANEIKNAIGKNCNIELENTPDGNSYSVSFKKIKRVLDFNIKYSLQEGIKQIYEELENDRVMKSQGTNQNER